MAVHPWVQNEILLPKIIINKKRNISYALWHIIIKIIRALWKKGRAGIRAEPFIYFYLFHVYLFRYLLIIIIIIRKWKWIRGWLRGLDAERVVCDLIMCRVDCHLEEKGEAKVPTIPSQSPSRPYRIPYYYYIGLDVSVHAGGRHSETYQCRLSQFMVWFKINLILKFLFYFTSFLNII